MEMLEIVQETCALLNIPQPSQVAGSSDASSIQLLSLLNRAGRSLARDHAWSKLIVINDFVGVAQQVQTGQPPSSYDRFYPVMKIYDTNNKREVIGPLNAEDWAATSVSTLSSMDRAWTMLDGVINMLPAPTTDDDFRYAFVSKNWVDPASGSNTDAFALDTDEHLLSDELLILSLQWRWKKAKTLFYLDDKKDFEDERDRMIARDRGPKIIFTSRSSRSDDAIENSWPYTLG